MKNKTSVVLLAIVLACASGCRARPEPITEVDANKQVIAYPPRPIIAPPAFKVFHQDASSVTLVTEEHAGDEQIESLIWELRDAAHTHTFDRIAVPQKVVDARDPIIWFHVYRGSRCASEKYTSGTLPCGASYHAAGEFTLGGFKDRDHVAGELIHDENHSVQLWNPDPKNGSE